MSALDPRRVRTLLLVADSGSVTAAADALGYTQSAVSQQLGVLEREAGVPLLDRSRRPFRLTAHGALLRPHLERLLTAADAADTALADQRAGRRGRLRLAAFPSALSSFVPLALREFRRAHADVVVDVLEHEPHEAVEALRASLADVALVYVMPGGPPPGLDGLQRRELLVDELCLVLPERHRLARRRTVAVADLAGETLVGPHRDTAAGGFRALLERMCRQAGFSPSIAYETDDLQAAQAFAAAGLAAVAMHRLTVPSPPAGVVIRPLTGAGAGARRIEVLAPSGRPPAPVAALVDQLTRAAGGA